MKKFLIKKLPIIIILGLISIGILVLNFVHIKYEVITPYKISDVELTMSVDGGYEQAGSFNTTSVLHSSKVNVLSYLFSKLSPSAISYKSSNVVDVGGSRNQKSGSVQKQVSITDSIICAYKKANIDINYEYLGLIIETVSVYTPETIQVGDVITKVNGVSFSNSEEFLALYNSYRRSSKCYNEEKKAWLIPLTINDEDKIIETKYYLTDGEELVPVLGIYHYDYYKIDFESMDPKISLYQTRTGGPSGGLMQSLSIYNQLISFDYTYGKLIAGTGTIDVDGNVGEIGGMYSKIFTAYFNNVEIFFVPYSEDMTSNYEDAMKAYKALGSPKKLQIVKVSTIDDAINYLKSIGE